MLDYSNYGKIALDVIVSKVMRSPGEDMAVLLVGYESSIMTMLHNQNPGLQRYTFVCIYLHEMFLYKKYYVNKTNALNTVIAISHHFDKYQAVQSTGCVLLSRLRPQRTIADSQGTTGEGRPYNGK